MFDLGSGVIAEISGPPLVPEQQPVDLEHLFRMTLGDHALEREVLQLFDRQAAMLMEKIGQSGPAVVAAFAHTLKGSARGIGAWDVARCAAALEVAALAPKSDLCAEVRLLEAAVTEARCAIGAILRAH